jgi:UDPglucose--hexose-1-phosphate uridylyltransferase
MIPEAVATGGSPVSRIAGEPPASTLSATPARGAHEVIVESARHVDRASALSAAELQQVLETYAHRLRSWRDDGRFSYGLVFKNQGSRAGASIAHLHSQFIALPEIPPAVAAELLRAEDDYSQHDSCPYCRLIEHERSLGERIILDRDGYVAFCPFASLQPHEVWLLSERHEPSFEQRSPVDAPGRLAEVLHALLARLELIVPDAAYNMLLRTAPWRGHCHNWCHWRIELLPRVNSFAGFEIATGVHINPLAPEAAARQLRST